MHHANLPTKSIFETVVKLTFIQVSILKDSSLSLELIIIKEPFLYQYLVIEFRNFTTKSIWYTKTIDLALETAILECDSCKSETLIEYLLVKLVISFQLKGTSWVENLFGSMFFLSVSLVHMLVYRPYLYENFMYKIFRWFPATFLKADLARIIHLMVSVIGCEFTALPFEFWLIDLRVPILVWSDVVIYTLKCFHSIIIFKLGNNFNLTSRFYY